MKNAGVRFVMLFVGSLLLYAAGVVVRGQHGIRVLVSNQSGEMVRPVGLKVGSSGPRYDLGEFGVGIRKHIFVQPKTESHIALEFLDATGVSHSEIVVGYLERGYCGSASAIIRPGSIVNVREHVDILFCKGSWLDFLR